MSSVLIVGGGLAGLAAASALAPRGFRVTVLESRNRLGGRASSFSDAATGQIVDACQHVSMGCCTNFAHFCGAAGIDHFLVRQPALSFMTPDGRVSRFGADPLPAPWHLARSLWRAHYLTFTDKIRIAWAMRALQRANPDDDQPLLPWLQRRRQNRRTIERFWSVVLVSALNETLDRLGLKYARKVFVDGFLRHRRGFDVYVPSVPLARLYGDEMQSWFQQQGVTIETSARVAAIHVDGRVSLRERADGRVSLHERADGRLSLRERADGRLSLRERAREPLTAAEGLTAPSAPFRGAKGDTVVGVELGDGRLLEADSYVVAVPHERLLDLMPDSIVQAHECFSNLKNLQASPITSVHLWFDRPVLDRPHVVLVDCLGQWVFQRGEHYLQVVVSASQALRALGHDEMERRIVAELRRLFPKTAAATIVRSKVITERTATFSPLPGVDRWRPAQETPIANLFLAGDWTATGWPGTMESAVRSGYLAAEAILRRAGRSETIVQRDL